jgi:predicted ATP-grasp superfamily ATP-dependent carboligase
MRSILFLNGEYTHTIDMVRELKTHRPDIVIHALLKSPPFVPLSKHVDHYHLLPPDQDIVGFVARLQQAHGFDLILPVGYPEIEVFSRQKSRLNNLWVDDADIIAKTVSKKETLCLAKRLGVPIPRSLVLEQRTSIDNLRRQGFSLPLFVKSEREAEGKVRAVAKTSTQFLKLSDEIFRQGGRPLVQEFIADPITYGVGVLAERGRVKKSFCHQERLSYPPAGGSAVILASFTDQRLVTYTEKLISSLGYTGLALAEFKYHPKLEDYVLMEVNAKCWASILFALRHEPSLFPWLEAASRKSPEQIFLFPDRLVSYLRYAPVKGLRGLLQFLASAQKKRISWDSSDQPYECGKILLALSIYVPRLLKKIFRHA